MYNSQKKYLIDFFFHSIIRCIPNKVPSIFWLLFTVCAAISIISVYLNLATANRSRCGWGHSSLYSRTMTNQYLNNLRMLTARMIHIILSSGFDWSDSFKIRIWFHVCHWNVPYPNWIPYKRQRKIVYRSDINLQLTWSTPFYLAQSWHPLPHHTQKLW